MVGKDFIKDVTDFFDRKYNADMIKKGSSGRFGSPKPNGPSLPETGQEFLVTHSKIRKTLISSGNYTSSKAVRIQKLKKQGFSVEQIAEMEHLSVSSIQNYLPYTKGVYNTEDCSDGAQKVRDWRAKDRERKKVVEEYKNGTATWRDVLVAFEGARFSLASGGRFHYKIVEDEIEIKGERYQMDKIEKEILEAMYQKMGLEKKNVFND